MATTRSRIPSAPPHRPRGTPRASRRTKVRATALVLVHLAVIAHVAHWKLAGTTLTPLEPSEAGDALALGYVNAGFLLFAALLLATLVFGRFFCGWACHVVAYQDLCAALLGKLGLRPKPVRSRVLAWVPALAALWMFALPPLARALEGGGLLPSAWRLHLSTSELWARFPGPGIALLTFAVDGFLIVWLLGAKGFCTYGCPYGALFSLADRGARGRIRVTDACEGCGHCTATCTSNVRVHEEVARFGQVVDTGCMKCLDCVSVCPKDALYFGFGEKRAGASRRTWDFGWGEELLLGAVFLLGMFAWRGLYGQVPFLLAIGLAVLSALAAITLWRLFRAQELTLQALALRSAGRTTRAGRATLAVCVAWLALGAHGGAVQYHARRGEALFEEVRTELPRLALERAPETSVTARRARDGAEHLRAALGLGWVETPGLRGRLAALYSGLGQHADAERELVLLVERDPTEARARLLLAEVLARLGRPEEALDQVRAVLAFDERDRDAALALLGLAAVPAVAVEANLDMAALMQRGGDRAGAIALLEGALARHPGDERLSARLATLRTD